MHDISRLPPPVEAKPVNAVDGRLLSWRLKKGISAPCRALLAHQLTAGELTLHHLTRSQARALTGASDGYLTTVRRVGPEQRRHIGRGRLSLAALHNGKRELTDAAVDKLVAKIGVERVINTIGIEKVFAALDALTKPPVPPAEADEPVSEPADWWLEMMNATQATAAE